MTRVLTGRVPVLSAADDDFESSLKLTIELIGSDLNLAVL